MKSDKADQSGSQRGIGPWRMAWRRFRRSRSALIGLCLVAVMLAAAVAAPKLAPHSYSDEMRFEIVQRPSGKYWMGLDSLYRDVYSRALYGCRASLTISLGATAIAVVIGVLFGALAGYAGGWVDEALMRVADAFSAFPGILLAVAIAAVFEDTSAAIVLMALGLAGWSNLARVIRSRTLSLREEEFVIAARALGARPGRIILRHVLPNCLALIIVSATLLMAGNILGEAGLGFLGIGVKAPYPSWGGMLSPGETPFDPNCWWMIVFPGLAICLTVLGFNLLGDGLRDALDPRSATGTPEA